MGYWLREKWVCKFMKQFCCDFVCHAHIVTTLNCIGPSFNFYGRYGATLILQQHVSYIVTPKLDKFLMAVPRVVCQYSNRLRDGPTSAKKYPNCQDAVLDG